MTVPTRRGHSSETPDEETTAAPQQVEAKRINVVVTADVVQALERVMKNEQVTLTEAVRRLVGYGDFVYRQIKEEDAEVLVRKDDNVREIVLL